MLNVDQFVADCRAALTQSTPEPAVKEILERTVASSSEVEAALGTPREGKIGILHHDRDLTILNVVWTPGMAVYPHDHRMWAVIGLYGGREDNTFYRRSPEGLQYNYNFTRSQPQRGLPILPIIGIRADF